MRLVSFFVGGFYMAKEWAKAFYNSKRWQQCKNSYIRRVMQYRYVDGYSWEKITSKMKAAHNARFECANMVSENE